MKILCIIDHFGPGGAQRQMVNLARGLSTRGHQVEMFVYFPEYRFFRPVLDQAGIPVHEVQKGRGFSLQVLWRLGKLIRKERYDGMISFLGAPSVYAELARLAAPGTTLVVSERSSHHGDRNPLAIIRRHLHRLSDYVVANSQSHAAWLSRHHWLRRRVRTIYNGFPIKDSTVPLPSRPCRDLKLLVIGRVGPEKNGINLVEAVSLFGRRQGYIPHVSWVGGPDTRPSGVAYGRRIEAALANHAEVKRHWSWLGERSDIEVLLGQHHALIHPSLYEGLPNAICEALIAGRPVLASNVCDHSFLVEGGERGFLFDPLDPHDMAGAMERLASLSDEQWARLSLNARRYAQAHLGEERMVNAYEALLSESTSVT